MRIRDQLLAVATVALSAAACARAEPTGPVRSPIEAAERAQRALRAAGLDEQVIDTRRQDGAWLVITRWPETSMAGHLVTVDAQTGAVTVERYRSVQLGWSH